MPRGDFDQFCNRFLFLFYLFFITGTYMAIGDIYNSRMYKYDNNYCEEFNVMLFCNN